VIPKIITLNLTAVAILRTAYMKWNKMEWNEMDPVILWDGTEAG